MFECESCPFETNNVDQIEFHEADNQGHRMYPVKQDPPGLGPEK